MKKVCSSHVELLSDVVLAVELVLAEHAQEYVAGQDVLEQHLAHVRFGHLRADRLAALREEGGSGGLVVGVVGLRRIDCFPQVGENRRKVVFELLLRLPEILDLG